VELGFEGSFAFSDGSVVAGGIDPDLVALLWHARELGEHVEVHAVCAKEDVAGKRVEDDEGVGEVVGDAGVRCGFAVRRDEAIAGIHVPAADDDDVAELRGGLAG